MATAALPTWDMTVVYPSLESPEFTAGFNSATATINTLAALFDELGIGQQARTELTDETVAHYERVINAFNAAEDEVSTLNAYIHSFVATDSRNNLAQAKLSELQGHLVRLAQLDTRMTAWLGSLDGEMLLDRSAVARDHAYALRKAQIEAAHLMSPAEEDLAAELTVSGGTAWGKLHSNVTSQLMVPVEQAGTTAPIPMSVVRTMAFEADRTVREQGYRAELAAWERSAVPLAAALNSIKGQVNTLDRRRHWESPLDAALFNNNIDRATLDAMMSAAHASFPHFRRYLRAKAHALRVPALAWYDLFAPVGRSSKAWSYQEAQDFIVEQFATYSPKLSEYADRAFRENWIDAEPRAGKRDGAFCMRLRRDESRIFANFKPAFSAMSTLAHELGHGYHNLNLAERTALQHATPMTLAETASIFCQTIINQAALAQSDRDEQIAILDESLQDACQVVVDITSRFLFEQAVFDGRQNRELSVDELNELMLQAQRDTYGDGLDQSLLHPYMWAVKGHYYSSARSFYNFPYMFGLLFGLGLYAQYKQDPDTFRANYDRLLSSTGLDDAATLAARFGIDIRTPAFWEASLAIVREDVDRFEQLVRAS